ncbi:hypothetical protein O0I10_001093 [Lichtheimia ornata]|uniref:DNA mismatch repair protein MSH5 n=1 Tax=Lichtheimia ornata TaxID=688661 RepID=A0AAD7Y351_9FUNG|nr:uncharacterized protein O0I10_001093 [Lichtheimia ornata]KAJ8662917.1 hypothetical protein O0I10_001093 [Lichtheimia ornata]
MSAPPPAPAYTAPLPSVKRMSRSGSSSRYAASNNEAQLVSPSSEYPIKRQRITHSPLNTHDDEQPTSIQPQSAFTMQPFTHTSVSMSDEIGMVQVSGGSSIMALQWKGGKLGCAYYTQEYRELHVMDDVIERSPADFATQLIQEINPRIILLEYNADDILSLVQSIDGEIQVEKLQGKDFGYEHGRYSLISWFAQINDDNEAASDNATHHHVYCEDPYDGRKRKTNLQLQCMINLDSIVSIGCAGALLTYIDKLEDYTNRPIGNEMAPQDLALRPVSLRSFSSNQYMHVSNIARRVLGIFEKDVHPNTHQKRNKESLSLFGLLNHTVTPIGQHLLQSWIQRPTLDLNVLEYRHTAISHFSTNDTVALVKELRGHLKHIKNIPRMMSMIRENRATVHDWQQLLQFAYYSMRIQTSLASMDLTKELQVTQKIKSAMGTEKLRRVGSAINDMIDFEQSRHEGRVVVKENVDEHLDKLRETYDNLEPVLLQVAQEISQRMPPELATTCNVVYFPQLGYFVAVTREYEQMFEYNLGLPPDFRLQFTTDANAYFKNDRTNELDESLGDNHGMIIDREIELVQYLTEELSTYFSDLLAMADACAELDCLLSLAHAARIHEYVRPEMTEENKIEIHQGRHPIQEMCVDVFIANDAYLVGGLGKASSDVSTTHIENSTTTQQHHENETASIALLTGANYSGKSVYLRQVALIVYMAHVGSFVPASSAVIGLTDKIFTCVQTIETVSKLVSAFALDLQNLSQAARDATGRSLVIIDEFGNGTDAADGAGLLCATLEHFLSKGEQCPKVLAITHFHELLAHNIISPTEHRIKLLTMEILSQSCTIQSSSSQSKQQADEVVFLYRVVPGSRACNSYGAWCASIAGIPTPIVQRALELSHLIDNNKQIRPIYSKERQAKLDAIEDIALKLLESQVTNDTLETIRQWVKDLDQVL